MSEINLFNRWKVRKSNLWWTGGIVLFSLVGIIVLFTLLGPTVGMVSNSVSSPLIFGTQMSGDDSFDMGGGSLH